MIEKTNFALCIPYAWDRRIALLVVVATWCCDAGLLLDECLWGNLLEGVCHERVHCLAFVATLVSYDKVEAGACATTADSALLLK